MPKQESLTEATVQSENRNINGVTTPFSYLTNLRRAAMSSV